MSDALVLVWGAVGGLITYLLVFTLPALTRLLEADEVRRRTSARRVLAFLGILVIYLLLGAGSAAYVGAANIRGALTAGATGEALLKGIASGSKALAALGKKLSDS